jgi:hypothetical protein
MAFQVSPGVLSQEIDLTNVVPATATSIGAIAGAFAKGPMNQVTTIESEKQLIEIFGRPNNSNFETWFSAANFLQYGNNLKVVRAETGARTSVATAPASISPATTGSTATSTYTMTSDGGADASLLQVQVDGVLQDPSTYTISGTSFTFLSGAPADDKTFTVRRGVRITNDESYEFNNLNGSNGVGEWAAKYSGKIGNSLGVSICQGAAAYEEESASTTSGANAVDSAGSDNGVVNVVAGVNFQVGDIIYLQEIDGQEYEVTEIVSNALTVRQLDNPNGGGLKSDISSGTAVRRRWRFYDLFNAAPGTSEYAKSLNMLTANDEMHIVVYDVLGEITGNSVNVAGKRLASSIESYGYVSKHLNAKTSQGSANYYPTVINRSSQHIRWMDHPTTGATDWGTAKQASNSDISFDSAGKSIDRDFSVNGMGADDFSATVGEIKAAYDLMADSEIVDVNLVISGQTPDATDSAKQHLINMIDFVEGRKDCVAFISPQRSDVVGIPSSVTQTSNVKAFFNQTGIPSSSYAVFDSGYKYMFDRYNDVFRFVPLNGDIAGLCANTDFVADPWFSPGGFNRGQIRGAVKLAFNPSKTQRDELYPARINPVVSFPGEGTVLFGDKTALSKPSAFDRINVRRLFLVLKKSISRSAKFQLFEFNDEFTRSQFRNTITPFLRDVQGRRGITDFSVVCDASNNTTEVIDRNEFVAEIYVKPNRSINFISLSFVAVRTGVSFSEVGG